MAGAQVINDAEDIAGRIDSNYRPRNTGNGYEYDCVCPLASLNHKNGDKGKSFSIRNDSRSVFGVAWNCFVCDKKELSDHLFSISLVQKPPREGESVKPKKIYKPSDAELQAKERKDAERLAKQEANAKRKAEKEAERQARIDAGEELEDEKGKLINPVYFPFVDEDGSDYVQERRFEVEGKPGEKVPVPFYFENGEWIKGLGGRQVPLQFLPEVLDQARAGKRIYLVEGPKKAKILRDKGLFATCNYGGSKKPWREELTLSLLGAEVVIVCDNDDTGRAWGLNIARKLLEKGSKCRLVNMDFLDEPSDDVEQYLEKYSLAEFISLCNGTPLFGPEELPPAEIEVDFETFNNTDLSNGERVAKRFQGQILWTGESGWQYWDGRVYQVNSVLPMRVAKQNARLISKEAEKANEANKKRLYQWAKASESTGKLRSALELAKDEPGMSASILEMNPDPLVLNCQNGLLSLSDRRLIKHNRKFLCSKIGSVEYDHRAKCPVFDEFLKQITGGDKDMIDFILRALGYTLTGLTVEECFFFLWGTGRNGKSKLIAAVYTLLGTYASSIATEALMVQQNKNTANYELADLPSVRMLSASETEQGQRLAEGFVKRITGGSPLTCRNLNMPFFNFKPEFKLWLEGNKKPTIKGNDPAIKDRLLLIPLNVYIAPEKRDPMLYHKFLGELPGILNRCLDGLADYLAGEDDGKVKGLRPDKRTREASRAYFQDQDMVGQFIAEKCQIQIGSIVRGKDIYKAYAAYCEHELEQKHFENNKNFYEQIEGRSGITAGRDMYGKYFKGISINGLASEREVTA